MDHSTGEVSLSPTELLRRTRAGDAQAREALFTWLRPRLRRRARQQLRGQEPLGHQPSDLSDEASLRLDQSLTALRDESEGGICEYAFAILDNLIQDCHRAAATQKRDEGRTCALTPSTIQSLSSDQPRQSEQAREKERWQSLWAVLARLTDAQRLALVLRLKGASLKEIAAAVGQDSQAAAANLLARAVKAVQRELGRTFAQDSDGQPDDEGRVLLAFRQYQRAVERGAPPPRAALLAEHPAIAAPLRELLEGLDRTLADLAAAVRAEDEDG